MKIKSWIINNAIIFSTIFSRFSQDKIGFEIISNQNLEGIPSASGITSVGKHLFVIADNTPWIYKLNKKFETVEKMQLSPTKSSFSDTYTKENKPDFEAITAVKWGNDKELLIFGSGSKSSKKRDVLIRIDYDKTPSINTYSLKKFYDKIGSSTKLSNKELNIEAVAVKDNDIFLFNRGENIILKYNLKDFVDYLKDNGKCPKPKEYEIKLPKINGVKASFSGAEFIPDEKKIIFTASVEDNSKSQPINEVLGSFIGIIKLNKLEDRYKPKCIPIKKNGKTLKIKVESVAVLDAKDPKKAKIILVTDSDTGKSEIIRGTINWN